MKIVTTTDNMKWAEFTTIGSKLTTPNDGAALIFMNNAENIIPYTNGEWYWLDLSDRLPHGAQAVFLSGNFNITQGSVRSDAMMKFAFRRYPDDREIPYILQALDAGAISGVRGTRDSVSIGPLMLDEYQHLSFKLSWLTVDQPLRQWPEGPAFCANFQISGYCR